MDAVIEQQKKNDSSQKVLTLRNQSIVQNKKLEDIIERTDYYIERENFFCY